MTKELNQEVIETFVKAAQEAGATQEQIEQFVSQRFNVKTAGEQLDELISGILKHAGVEKTEEATQHVTEVLKVAVDKGLEDSQAIELGKIAAQQLKGNNSTMSQPNFDQEKQAAMAEGFMKAAQDYGLTYGQSIDLLHSRIAENELMQKRAFDMQQLQQLIQTYPELAGALGGGAVGAGAGAMMGGKGNRGNGAIAGGLGGAALGAGGLSAAMPAGLLNQLFKQPVDPRGQSASQEPQGAWPDPSREYLPKANPNAGSVDADGLLPQQP